MIDLPIFTRTLLMGKKNLLNFSAQIFCYAKLRSILPVMPQGDCLVLEIKF